MSLTRMELRKLLKNGEQNMNLIKLLKKKMNYKKRKIEKQKILFCFIKKQLK